jgi:DNA-binding YbaB/EbfC family protein
VNDHPDHPNDPGHDGPVTPDQIAHPDDGQAGAGDPLAALLGGGGGGAAGGFDFGALLEQAGEMQARLLAAQQQAASTEVEGVAGGGAVRVAITGDLDVRRVTIAPEAVDPDDVEMLQDLVLAAIRDALDQVQQLQQGGLDLGGMDLGGLLGGA